MAQETMVRDSVVQELHNTRLLLVRASTRLEQQLHDAHMHSHDPHFVFGNNTVDFEPTSFPTTRPAHDQILKNTRRNVSAPSTFFPTSIPRHSPSVRKSGSWGGGGGAGSYHKGIITKEMFNMRPRICLNQLSAAFASKSYGPYEAEKRTGIVSRTPEEKKLFRAANRPASAVTRSGSKMLRSPNSSRTGTPQSHGLQQTLLAAVTNDDSETVVEILSRIHDPRRQCLVAAQALATAAKNGSEPVCRAILDNTDFDCRQTDLDSALFCAAQFGNVSIVCLLLEKGANVHSTDADGATCLILAAFHGQLECVTQLLLAGACVDVSDSDGYTALMWAAFKGRTETANTLLQKGICT